MKTSRLMTLPLLALFLSGCPQQPEPKKTPPPGSTPTVTQRAEATYETTKEAVASKLAEWNLTPADIKADLEKSGRVVREKAAVAGEKAEGAFDNARLVTLIKGKFISDKDLSALKINVDVDNGVVTLKGSVASEELIGRAVALALSTQGVTQVVGLLTVDTGETSAAPTKTSPGMM